MTSEENLLNKINRPLDLLNERKGSNVLIYCKDGKILRGRLVAFDIHINLVIGNMQETGEEGKVINYGDTLIRGDNVNFISPAKQ